MVSLCSLVTNYILILHCSMFPTSINSVCLLFCANIWKNRQLLLKIWQEVNEFLFLNLPEHCFTILYFSKIGFWIVGRNDLIQQNLRLAMFYLTMFSPALPFCSVLTCHASNQVMVSALGIMESFGITNTYFLTLPTMSFQKAFGMSRK